MFLADVAALHRDPAPIPDRTLIRTHGINGTRFTAVLDRVTVGYLEVESCNGDAGRIVAHNGWADVGNLHIEEPHRRRRIASWLLGQAAEWLRLGHIDRLLDYANPDDEDYIAFLQHAGFTELTRTARTWKHYTTSSTPEDAGGVLPMGATTESSERPADRFRKSAP